MKNAIPKNDVSTSFIQPLLPWLDTASAVRPTAKQSQICEAVISTQRPWLREMIDVELLTTVTNPPSAAAIMDTRTLMSVTLQNVRPLIDREIVGFMRDVLRHSVDPFQLSLAKATIGV
jgi:hypothetical protein